MRTGTLIASTLVVMVAAVANGKPALAASPVEQDYGTAMRTFAPEIERWVSEAQVVVDAFEIKPESACGAEVANLVLSGDSIAADLRGTAGLSPDRLVPVHDTLTGSIAGMAASLSYACEFPEGAAAGLSEAEPQYRWAMDAVKSFVKNGRRGA